MKKNARCISWNRREMGKTALIERLFNITFFKNNGVIPFYYEVKEIKKWIGDFCVDFFLTFLYQYIAFKSRKVNYLGRDKSNSLEEAKKAAINEGLDYLTGVIENVRYAVDHDYVDILWDTVREAPKNIAYSENEYIVQMIDEFQFLNAMIYWDKDKKNLADTLAGGLTEVLEFETLNNQDIIKLTWMEYVNAAFGKVNDRNAKKIVLHLFKHKDRELTRKELLEQLNLDMTDEELELKMEALVKGDIVIREIKKEYAQTVEKLKRQYRRLLGKYDYQSGRLLQRERYCVQRR